MYFLAKGKMSVLEGKRPTGEVSNKEGYTTWSYKDKDISAAIPV